MLQSRLSLFVLVFVSLCAHANEVEGTLALEPYQFNVAGHIAMPMKLDRHDDFHLGLKIAPAFGVFVANNLEQRVQMSLLANYVYTKQERIIKTPIFWDL